MTLRTLRFLTAAAALTLPLAIAIAQDAAPSVPLGSKDQAKWTPTTIEAASAPDNKKILENAKVVTLTGEIVDVSCYLQLGKRGEKHVACGQKCVLAGQPAGILDDEGNLTLVMPEQHHPRRDGEVSLAQTMADLMGKRVTATGMLTDLRGSRALYLQAPPKAAAAPAATGAPAPAPAQ